MATSSVVNINETDMRLITPHEARRFSERLNQTLEFAEVSAMHLSRLAEAHSASPYLGGWPEGFTVSVEATAAFALLAQDLDDQAERMQKWAEDIRHDSTYVFAVRGREDDDA